MDEVKYLDTTLVLGCNLYTYCLNNPVINIDNNCTTHLNTGKSFSSMFNVEGTNGIYTRSFSECVIPEIYYYKAKDENLIDDLCYYIYLYK